jgi:Zn-dependent protease with chaperone function
MRRLFLTLTLLTLPALAARKPGEPLKPGFNTFSKQQDIQMGQEAAAQVKQQQQVIQNPVLQAYVSKVGMRIAGTREAAASGFPFSFSVVADPSINAFALPGGPMFIHTGLLEAVDNEAQLAGVMGHELAHVVLRHGTHQASKASLLQLPAALAAGAAGAGGGLLGSLAQLGIGLGANSVLLKFSRDAESEADALGSHFMAEAGYDPIEMARFFNKLNSTGGPSGPQFLSDHPNPLNREAAIQAEVKTLPARTYGYNSGDFAKAKAELAKLPKTAPKPANGAAAAPAQAPDLTVSPGSKALRNQAFSLQYPENWQVTGENTSTITIAPRGGVVQQGLGLGAILSSYQPQQNPVNLNRDTQALIAQLRQGDPNLAVMGASQRARVDNRDALVTTLRGSSPFGGDEQDTLVTVATSKGLFYLVFVTPQKQATQVQDAFNRLTRSLRFAQ